MTPTARHRPRPTPNDPERSQEVQCGAHTLVIPVRTNALISGHQVSMVAARVSSSGICESIHQARKRCSRWRVRWGSPPRRTVASRLRNSSLAIHAERICALGSSAVIWFHIFAKLFSDKRSRAQSRRRRLAHSGSSLRPRRSRRSQVTRGEPWSPRRWPIAPDESGRPPGWRWATAPACGSPRHTPQRDRSPRTRRPPGTRRCALAASPPPRRRCGPHADRAGPDRRPGRRTRCPMGPPAPTRPVAAHRSRRGLPRRVSSTSVVGSSFW